MSRPWRLALILTIAIVAVCVVLVLVIMALDHYWLGAGRATVTLQNRSEAAIAGGHIAVCGERLTLGSIRPGTAVRLHFDVSRKCHYEVRLEMRSGAVREAKLGYLTHGLAIEDEIVVTQDGVRLGENRKVESPRP